jgi:NAD(P)-dependent dehydrogenase (short-subunit alcohol dehydrogenase family)
VTCAEDVKSALDKTVEAFGRLDFAFNNAGIEQPVTPTADLTEEQWDRIVDIDLRGIFLCMKYEIPLMLKQGGGAIVNTSSGAGVKGIAGQAAYCAAKFGVVPVPGNTMTRPAVALSLRRSVGLERDLRHRPLISHVRSA